MDKIDDTLAQLHLSPNKMGPTPICLPCPNSLPKNDLREYLEIFKKHILYGEKIEIVAVNSAFTTGEDISCCSWIVKFKHSLEREERNGVGLWDYFFNRIENNRPLNIQKFDLAFYDANHGRIHFNMQCDCSRPWKD
ncbi:uncharacterized protein LOC123007969 isoform X1 [Tribolium madens]|uniref:uncharacterized protein LOC123007969 isoform X1 n=1 Tax=Tribolium madens TaxID=41895 RepID=UPI001CF754F1|nr:uncharacterized protein LOC123007969 isoform X1 [Tribolium madens]